MRVCVCVSDSSTTRCGFRQDERVPGKLFVLFLFFLVAVSHGERPQMLPPRETRVNVKRAPTHVHLADGIFMAVCL